MAGRSRSLSGATFSEAETMSDTQLAPAIRGATLRWTWTEGPTSGKTYEHVFHEDGTVEWREVGGQRSAAPAKESGRAGKEPERAPYAAFEVRPDVFAISYRASSGFTLTVVLDDATGDIVGFASNSDSWFPVRGTSERVH
jgi:hypothetical protein